MDKKLYIPRNKEDLDFIKYLQKKNIKDIISDIPILLEWLQDFNWSQANLICEYLKKYPLDYYSNDILNILNGNDDVWKYWILKKLVMFKITLNSKVLIEKLKDIYLNPTYGETEEEVNILSQEILCKIEKDSC